MVDGQSVVEFCNLEVEPMYHESDHIHVTALTQLIGIPVQVKISGSELPTYRFSLSMRLICSTLKAMSSLSHCQLK